MDQTELVRSLRLPEAYGAADAVGAEVGFRETHASWLFFTPERVYKVKKPVRYPFLDFSTLERRRRFCEEEVRLNARLAPGVYRGVVPIARADAGAIRVDAPGEVVEWAVEMERLPEHDMLEERLARGEVDNAKIGALAALLAEFHAEADGGPEVAAEASPEAVLRLVEQNLDELEPFVGDDGATAPSGLTAMSPRRHEFLRERARRFVRTRGALLARRVREGRVRDGHGDLHAGNICDTGGRLVIYDRIEFEPRFRYADVACDLAFLAMDLDDRGFPGFAKFLVRRYGEVAKDTELGRVVPFYKTYRALVRGKVACLAAAAPDASPERRAEQLDRARRYFNLATAYEVPAALVLMCGLPGTGKTWLARQLARPLRASVHRSDVRRKRIAREAVVPAIGETAEEVLYSRTMTERTYRDLLDAALRDLRAEHATIADATFSGRLERRVFVDAASRLGLPWFVVHVKAPEDVVQERLEARAHDPGEASDADWAVYLRARESFEPPDELAAARVVATVSGVESPAVVAGRLIDRMLDAGR